MMKTITRFLLALFVCIAASNLVTGCGFHLRGNQADSTAAGNNTTFTVNTDAKDLYDLFYVALHRNLEKARLLPDGKTAADFMVTVGAESVLTRTLTINTYGRTADSELTMTVPIIIVRNGNTVAINKVSARRTYLYDTNAQLFSDRQAEQLKVEMREEISQRIIDQLRLLYRNPAPVAPVSTAPAQ